MSPYVDTPDKEITFIQSLIERPPPLAYQPGLWDKLIDNVSIILTTNQAYDRCNNSLREERDTLRQGAIKQEHEMQQILGQALGYPWYKDDQKNFSGATEADGVCVGDHVALSLADEVAEKITKLERRIVELETENVTLTRTGPKKQS